MSNKYKFRLLGQSMFVLCVITAMNVGNTFAQNPYYSAAAADSQGASNGFEAPVQVTSPFESNTVSAQTVSPNPAVGQNVSSDPNAVMGNTVPVTETSGGYVQAASPVYGAGYTTMPDYPRNNMFTPEAASTPDPPAEYPQTREEMAPELIRRDPPLTPYDQQETYSYMTNSSTSSSTACQHCNEGYGNPYLWQVGAGIVVRHHGRMDKAPTMFYTSNGFLISANTTFNISAGLNVDITRYLGRNSFNYDIWGELKFDGLNKWSAANTYLFNSDTGEYSDSFQDVYTLGYGDIAGLTTREWSKTTESESGETTTTTYKSVPITQHMNYDIDMNTGELIFQFRKRGRPDPLIGHPNGTWTRECQGGLSYTHAFGLGFISNNESLDWDGISYVFSKTGDGDYSTVSYTESGYVHNKTSNNMVGAVLGGEFADKHCIWSWGMRWRMNPYLNFEEVRTEISDGHSFTIRNTGLSYMAQWGMFGTLKTGKYVKWRLGYDVSCLGNTAVAPRNMVYSVTDNVVDTAYSIYQTLTLQCSIVW